MKWRRKPIASARTRWAAPVQAEAVEAASEGGGLEDVELATGRIETRAAARRSLEARRAADRAPAALPDRRPRARGDLRIVHDSDAVLEVPAGGWPFAD